MSSELKTALILGGSSEIGQSIARHLLSAGVSIYPTYCSNRSALDNLLEEADSKGLLAGVATVDAEDISTLSRVIQHAFTERALHIVVNCIGVSEITNICDKDAVGKWHRCVNVNLNFLFSAAHMTLPLLKKSGWGRWINISSVSAFETRKGVVCYSVSKAAQNNIVRFMAQEAGSEITVNSICPGMTNTQHLIDSNQRIADQNGISLEEVNQEILEDTYTRRFLDVEEIGSYVRYLCSHEARSITGQSIVIAGGRG